MVALEEKYRSSGLSIMCFPSAQFGGQELDQNADIDAFVKEFGADHGLLMMDKIDCNGAATAPAWQWLKDASGDTGDVTWNFRTKFVVARDGTTVYRHDGNLYPDALEADLVHLLGPANKAGL